MKRTLLVLALLALPVCAAPTRYYVKPVYTSLRFSIVKWGVLKEEGIFRDFDDSGCAGSTSWQKRPASIRRTAPAMKR